MLEERSEDRLENRLHNGVNHKSMFGHGNYTRKSRLIYCVAITYVGM